MKHRFLLGAAVAATFCAVSAHAQDAEDGDLPGDIIVTATREETMLSKTPLAVTAVTSEGLRDAGVTDARGLNEIVPNLKISTNVDSAIITIRGVASTDITAKGDPSAAFLVNGIYIARPIEALNSFFDLQRVEVLRGPQGTLYGRNTTAGVINVISARPKDEFEASADASYGNLGQVNATGMINLGLGNDLGVRAAINYERSDSYVIQPQPITNSINPSRDNLSGRLSFGGEVGEKFNFVIVGDYTQSKGGLFSAVGLNNAFPGYLPPTARTTTNSLPLGPVTITPPVDPVYQAVSSTALRTLRAPLTAPDEKNNKYYGIMGEFTYDLGPAELTYLGSYREAKRRDKRVFFFGQAFYNPATFWGDFKQTSHELRLAFGKGNPLHGQIGGYLFRERSDAEITIGQPFSAAIAGAGGPPNFNAVGFGIGTRDVKSDSNGVFGQITYDITPELRLTGGVRYTHDKKSSLGGTFLVFNAAANSACGQIRCVTRPNIAARSFNRATWKVGIDYDAPDLGLFYANVSTGYKAGGFNDGCAVGGGVGCTLSEAQLYYEPETLTAFEAGAKLGFLDNKLRVNLAAFHYDYKNLQLTSLTSVGGIPTGLITNAGAAKVDGVEFEALMSPSGNDLFSFSINYLDARYTRFSGSMTVNTIGANGLPVRAFPGGPPVPTIISRDFRGLPLDRAPKWSASAGYTHTFRLGDSKIEASVRTFMSASYKLINISNLVQFEQPAFTKTDLTLTYKAPGDRWYLQGFVKNIEDTVTIGQASVGTESLVYPEEPRTYGIRAGFKF